jgi:glycosyltransferase involved in cell wall biosynthesis
MNSTLSVVLSVHNEEKLVEDALKSVRKSSTLRGSDPNGLADEIVFVDNESTDRTVKIAKKYTDKIFSHKNTPLTLNKPKNFGFSKATGDWILSLDADERISPELSHEIRGVLSMNDELITKNNINGYWMPRKNFVFGKWLQHGIWWPDYQLRLFRRGKGKFPGVHNHELLVVEGQTEKLKSPLIHQSYTSITQYVDKFNHTYTDNEAENFIKSGKKIVWLDALRFPLSDFMTNFFARGSYKDGLHGLTLSVLQAFYSFEVFAKVWEKQAFWEYNSNNLLHDVKQEVETKKKEFIWWYTKELVPWFLKPKQLIKRTVLSRKGRSFGS